MSTNLALRKGWNVYDLFQAYIGVISTRISTNWMVGRIRIPPRLEVGLDELVGQYITDHVAKRCAPLQ